MRGGHRGQCVGKRPGQDGYTGQPGQADHKGTGRPGRKNPFIIRRNDQKGTGNAAGHEYGGAQPRVPRRHTVKQDGTPNRGPDNDRAHGQAGPESATAGPQKPRPDADNGANGGSEGDGVVRVDDPLSQAEHQPGNKQPTTPEDHGGAGAAGAGLSPGRHQYHGQQY